MAGLTSDCEDSHEAFTLTARLRTGIGFDLPYGLDLAGILATRVRMLERERREAGGRLVSDPLPDTTEEEPYDLNLPLGRCTTGPEWHWLASCAIPVEARDEPEPRVFYRTADYAWAQRAATRPLPHYLSPSSGAYRDVMMPAPVVTCQAVQWQAVGDADEVHRLVRGIRFLGRRRAVGEGRVLHWTIDRAPASVGENGLGGEWAHLAPHTDQLIRPCPVECVQALGLPDDTWRMGRYALRPPSWHPDRLMELAMSAEEEEW